MNVKHRRDVLSHEIDVRWAGKKRPPSSRWITQFANYIALILASSFLYNANHARHTYHKEDQEHGDKDEGYDPSLSI
jgi:hypothetical protein